MPVVEVYLHTILQRSTAKGLQKQLKVTLPNGSKMVDLIRTLCIDLDPDHMLLVVNGKVVELDYILRDDDKINLMPALSGGVFGATHHPDFPCFWSNSAHD
jgi:sulfur carrier protein ThiS